MITTVVIVTHNMQQAQYARSYGVCVPAACIYSANAFTICLPAREETNSIFTGRYG